MAGRAKRCKSMQNVDVDFSVVSLTADRDGLPKSSLLTYKLIKLFDHVMISSEQSKKGSLCACCSFASSKFDEQIIKSSFKVA